MFINRKLPAHALAIVPFGLAIAMTSLAGCASQTSNTNDENTELAEVGVASDTLIIPPPEAGGFTYVGDYAFQNAGLCIQPVSVSNVLLPRLGSCANAASTLAVYRDPQGLYNICVRNSLTLGEIPHPEPGYDPVLAYFAICLARFDKNTMRFQDVPFSHQATPNGPVVARPGRISDAGGGWTNGVCR